MQRAPCAVDFARYWCKHKNVLVCVPYFHSQSMITLWVYIKSMSVLLLMTPRHANFRNLFFLLHVNFTKWQITSNKSSSKCSEKNSVSSLSFKTYRLIIFSFLYLIFTGFGVSDKILWDYIFSEKQHCLNDWNVEQMRVKYNLYESSPS